MRMNTGSTPDVSTLNSARIFDESPSFRGAEFNKEVINEMKARQSYMEEDSMGQTEMENG